MEANGDHVNQAEPSMGLIWGLFRDLYSLTHTRPISMLGTALLSSCIVQKKHNTSIVTVVYKTLSPPKCHCLLHHASSHTDLERNVDY